MKITRVSLLTKQAHTLEVNVTEEQLAAWRAGTNVQDAMPQLTEGEREFVMTGITPEEWTAHFGEGEGDEEPVERDGTELEVHDPPGYGVHSGE